MSDDGLIPGSTPKYMNCPKCGHREKRSAMRYYDDNGKRIMCGIFVCVQYKAHLWESEPEPL